MKKLIKKFGRYNVIAFGIMGTGLLLFLLTPLLIRLFNFDSDIFGVLILIIGLAMFGIGVVANLLEALIRKKH
jgi:ABC-type transport system involved in cytochrome c biogenesis permease component